MFCASEGARSDIDELVLAHLPVARMPVGRAGPGVRSGFGLVLRARCCGLVLAGVGRADVGRADVVRVSRPGVVVAAVGVVGVVGVGVGRSSRLG
ncbi:MAG: hypothetical protein H7323_04275 [Frankiales bacterium]|nr:hypothetical protein [Frankiales bacterium]